MPNWCENFITFMSNGTPEGSAAIKTFHKKLNEIFEIECLDGCIWEDEIEAYLLCSQYGKLFEYNMSSTTGFRTRGYVTNISDLNYDSFHVCSYDAWSANNAFWYSLITILYGDLITFSYIANEPGMGLFYTNDRGFLPRYRLFLECGIRPLMKVPGAWDTRYSDNLFHFLDRNNPYVMIPSPEYTDWTDSYSYGIQLEMDGEEDDIIAECEDYIFGEEKPDINDIYDLETELNKIDKKMNVCVDEYRYSRIDLEDEINRNKLYKNLGGE